MGTWKRTETITDSNELGITRTDSKGGRFSIRSLDDTGMTRKYVIIIDGKIRRYSGPWKKDQMITYETLKEAKQVPKQLNLI